MKSVSTICCFNFNMSWPWFLDPNCWRRCSFICFVSSIWY